MVVCVHALPPTSSLPFCGLVDLGFPVCLPQVVVDLGLVSLYKDTSSPLKCHCFYSSPFVPRRFWLAGGYSVATRREDRIGRPFDVYSGPSPGFGHKGGLPVLHETGGPTGLGPQVHV